MKWLTFERYIALRYSRAGNDGGMSSFLSTASVLGLTLSVMSLIVVMSVMNGFEGELKSRMLQLLPFAQLTINPRSARQVSSMSIETAREDIRKKLLGLDEVTSTEPYVEGIVMLHRAQKITGATLLGIDSERSIYRDKISQSLIAGSMDQLRVRRYGVVIGLLLAQQLSVTVGDTIEVVVPRVFTTPLGQRTRSRRLEVVGVFEVGAEIDSNLVFANLATAEKLLVSSPNTASIAVFATSPFINPQKIEAIVKQSNASPSSFIVANQPWTKKYATLFNAVVMEKTMIFILMMSVVAVASFSIVAIILMTVVDKRSDIAVLRTMGATSKQILRLFMIQGVYIGVKGTLIGATLGVIIAPRVGDILAAIERLSGWQLFDPSVYFIPFLPSRLVMTDVYLVAAMSIFISVLVTIIPARRASQIDPALALAEKS